MSSVPLTKMSSKGQIVIPLRMRSKLGLKEGQRFAVMGDKDIIILKKVSMPSAEEAFEQLHIWGLAFAKKKGLRESDLQMAIKLTELERVQKN